MDVLNGKLAKIGFGCDTVWGGACLPDHRSARRLRGTPIETLGDLTAASVNYGS